MNDNQCGNGKVFSSSEGLERTNCVQCDQFSILIGAMEIKCNYFQACFISEAIRQLVSTDVSANRFEIKEYRGTSSAVEDIANFIKRGFIEVNEKNCNDLIFILKSLNNREMLDRVVNFRLKGEELSIPNCIQRLIIKEESKCNVNDEVDSIASHFCKVTSSQLEELKKFDVEILERILNSKYLCLNDEDSLVEFISSLGEEYKSLYDYVELRFLTSNGIERFLQLFSSVFRFRSNSSACEC
jgi:hypothetical protein